MAQPSITLTNPLAAEESVLRPSLRPGLLKSVRYNQSHRIDEVALFEIGKEFRPPRDGERLPDEREVLGVVWAGRDATAAVEVWTVLEHSLRLEGASLDQGPVAGLHPGRSARIVVAGEPIGALGEIDPGVLDGLGITGRVAWLELDLDATLALPARHADLRAGEPVPVERHRPGLRRGRRRPGRRGPIDHRRRGGSRCSRRCGCSTCSAATACRPTRGASPSPCGSRPTTAR